MALKYHSSQPLSLYYTVINNGEQGKYTFAGALSHDAPYFVDGRQHMQESLNFLLRAAGETQPYSLVLNEGPLSSGDYRFVETSNFVEMSYLHPDETPKGYGNGSGVSGTDIIALDNLWPFAVDSELYFWLFQTNDSPALFAWQTNFTTIPAPAELGIADPYWIAQELNYLVDYGVSVSTNGMTLLLQGGTHNLYGLSVQTALALDDGLDPATQLPVTPEQITILPGHAASFSRAPLGSIFSQFQQPTMQTVGYYFSTVASPGTDATGLTSPVQPYPLPLNATISVTNQTPPIIGVVGQPMLIGGWAKQQINNGASGKFAYLGQYFEHAYKVDTNGVVTTNETGILSPYGEFLPTEPGPVALVTMTNYGVNERGTTTVNVIKLQLDVNHDGNMDLSFAGPDNTSADRPFKFWVNNDFDSNGPELDTPARDCDDDRIGSVRDLEDFARLWIVGMPPLAASNGYTVKMYWRNVQSNPAVKIYNAYETDGGSRYLTDSTSADSQFHFSGNSIGKLVPGITNTFSAASFEQGGPGYFLFEGADFGKGELVLNIDHNGTNVAETSTWIDLHDIKDFYERMVVSNNFSSSPFSGGISNWTTGILKVEQAQISDNDESQDILLYVHGAMNNLTSWRLRSETMAKRLYWSGFHGKFASVHWASEPDFSFDFFNVGEVKGYKSAPAFKSYLSQLQSRFPGYKLHLFSHSHGGAVTSEALSQGAPFDTLILASSAMPASCYDMNAPTNSDLLGAEGPYPTPDLRPMGYHGAHTNFSGRILNYFNTDDDLLKLWLTDQTHFKPTVDYGYDGTNCLHTNTAGNVLIVTDSEESRGHIARSRTLALGALGPASGQTRQGVVGSAVDIKAQLNIGASRDEHSAFFTRPIQTIWPYYTQILNDIQPAQ